ncbi:MAG: DNA repair protein RadC [Clostridia bacterium]|nr:DNA repair protein RadC [Clostridia bacterium]
MVKEKSLNYQAEQVSNRAIKSPEDVHRIAKDVLNLDIASEEYFYILMLNTKNGINAISEVSHGSLNSSIVHPREVFKLAVLSNSSSIICIHNHPSGDPDPSKEDIETTSRLVQSGDILGIKVLDHIIVGDGRYTSLKEKGLM